ARGLANLAWKYFESRRITTIRNLEVCFPDWSPEKVQQQAKQVFVDMMLGVFETLNAWYKPYWFKNRVTIEGLEHITTEQAHGKGVLLFGTHSTL
ncbi:lauroyl acyltransferase, partial [Acinetobacter baumannii]|uniref:lysophospholipid acyltransferase family protein n=1 Tax=Acinetobacter baumannii TaxID=470 RepID=UPI003D1EDDE8|nr:lauroyl acyltransferase [Acinetobacter baumannii]